MVNPNIFNTQAARLPAATAHNSAKAPAYRFSPKHQLAQLVMTGSFNQTFYANAETQLTTVLALADTLDAEFIAKVAIYSREQGYMKDMPAFLTALLATKQPALLATVFNRVIDNGKMLRNFVQILRSGVTGRKSLGTRPKKLVQAWLNQASEQQLLQAAIGNQPSLADVVKMVHPKPTDGGHNAFFAWLLGKPFAWEQLPQATQALEGFKRGVSTELPEVPFQLLTHEKLTAAQWALLAERMGWQALRINLNTLARHGALALPGVAGKVAHKLANPVAIKKARAYPYQLLAAYRACGPEMPTVIRVALQQALELALVNVPTLEGSVVVCPDVSGSMSSPITGYRSGSTTAVRCIDVAALVAAAILRKHPTAQVLPFEQKVVKLALNPLDSVMTNADKLAAIGGGGTNCSAPLAQLVTTRAKVDTVILVSDNESWVDARRGATETLRQWQLLKRTNPQARLICIDLQPNTTTQAQEQADILNVGGFGDSVFTVISQFAQGCFNVGHWVEAIEAIQL